MFTLRIRMWPNKCVRNENRKSKETKEGSQPNHACMGEIASGYRTQGSGTIGSIAGQVAKNCVKSGCHICLFGTRKNKGIRGCESKRVIIKNAGSKKLPVKCLTDIEQQEILKWRAGSLKPRNPQKLRPHRSNSVEKNSFLKSLVPSQ